MNDTPQNAIREHRDTPRRPVPRGGANAFLAVRKLKDRRNMNDLVEDVHLSILDDPERADAYVDLLDATHDSEAVEGSLVGDDYIAAGMIRAAAEHKGVAEVARLKLAAIVHHLRIVLRRYEFGRKERKYMVSGEYVPPSPSGAAGAAADTE